MNFDDAIKRIPAPGGGGCHPYLLTCANLGVRDDLGEDEIVSRIQKNIPEGGRTVSEREIRDTVQKAMADSMQNLRPRHRPKLKSLRMTTQSMLSKFLHPSQITLQTLREASPIVFDQKNSEEMAVLTLRHLFDEDDLLFIGDTMDKGDEQIYSRDDWITAIEAGDAEVYPNYIIWNPLTGMHAKTMAGKDSLRCDRAVAQYKYTVVEFDEVEIDIQLRFWAACRLPVAALVYSGQKSVHGIIKVTNIRTLDDWRDQIKEMLYKRWLSPLGVDPACSNVSRLSRMPGAIRELKGGGLAVQKLLYLNPNATPLYLDA